MSLACSIVQGPTNGTLMLRFPSYYPLYSCYLLYTPSNNFSGWDSFTFKANDGVYDSSIARATIYIATNTPPTLTTPILVRACTNTPKVFSIPYTHPAADGNQVITSIIVTPPTHGGISGTGTSLTYTPNPGFEGWDTVSYKLSDGLAESPNTGTAYIQVLAPDHHGSNLVLLVVNDLLLPEISNEVYRLKADLENESYTANVISWDHTQSGAVLWAYLQGQYTNRMTGPITLAGAMLIGSTPTLGSTDLNFWNLETMAPNGGTYNSGPYNIWVSRLWGIFGSNPYGSEVTLLKRALDANHNARTGIARLPATAYHFDEAYGWSGVASNAIPIWPTAVELSTGPGDTANQALFPLGCRDAFIRGGDLLAEEAHGGNNAYTLYDTLRQVDPPRILHDLIQIRSVLNSSCVAGCLGGVVNTQPFSRGGGNLLSIGASQTTYAGSSVLFDTWNNAALRASLAKGLSWGQALQESPLQDKSYLIYHGDLSLPPRASATNAMPTSTLVASVTNGVPPLSVNFSATAADADGSIGLTEWFMEGFDFGRINPTLSEVGTPTPQSYTYSRAHRYLARVEAMDNYKARTFKEIDIRVAPRSDRPLRVVCGRVGPWPEATDPSLDYISPSTGKLWLHDQVFAAGTWGSLYFGYATYGKQYSGMITNTPDPELFRYAHVASGSTVYIPLSNGTYTVNLGFADVWSAAPGSLVLDIQLCGQTAATNVDPYALAGGGKTAVIVPLTAVVTNNLLTLQIVRNSASTLTPGWPFDGTWLNNFEIIPQGYTNHAPIAVDDTNQVNAGTSTNLAVLANDSDPDGDELVLASVSTPSNGTALIDGSTLLYTPGAGFSGSDSFTYTVADGNGGFATGTVSVLVVIPPPTITSSLVATGMATVPFSYTITASSAPTGFNAVGLPAGLSVNTTNGVISGVPATAGTNSVSITATNAFGSDTQLLVLMIEPATMYTLDTATNGVGVGSVSLNPAGGVYSINTTVLLTAIPATGSMFTGWSGDLSGAGNPTNLVMNGNKSVTATFAVQTFALVASAGPNGTISPTGSTMVTYGGSLAFTVTPFAWYAISNVSVDGSSVGTPGSYSFTNVIAAHTISAGFTALLAPQGTPEWWMAQYGLTNNFAVDELADPDNDGFTTRQEYLGGTDPNNPLSRPAYNLVPYAESFEDLTGWGGVYTNVFPFKGWSSTVPSGDRSRVTNLVYVFVVTNRPIVSATHTNVLRMDTQEALLKDSFGNGGFDMSPAVTYMDYMVNPARNEGEPPECTPTDSGHKAIVYVNTATNLAIYHGVAAADGALLSNTVSDTGIAIDPTNWYRITVALDATATNLVMLQVRLNGVAVTNAAAYADNWKSQYNGTGLLPPVSSSGTWFRAATTNGVAKKLMALTLKGSGYLDDLTVSTTDPFSGAAGAFLLIVVKGDNGMTSLGAAPVTSIPVPAGSSTQVVYVANDWYRIASLTSNGASLSAAAGVRDYTQMVVNISADISNAVSFALATPQQAGTATNVPTAWLTNWTESAVLAGSGDGFDLDTKYMLGLDPTSSNSYALSLENFNLAGSNAIMVIRRAVTGNLAPGGMNGHLWLQAASVLGASFTNIAGTDLTGSTVFDGTGRRIYTNSVFGQGKFFKAVIE